MSKHPSSPSSSEGAKRARRTKNHFKSMEDLFRNTNDKTFEKHMKVLANSDQIPLEKRKAHLQKATELANTEPRNKHRLQKLGQLDSNRSLDEALRKHDLDYAPRGTVLDFYNNRPVSDVKTLRNFAVFDIRTNEVHVAADAHLTMLLILTALMVAQQIAHVGSDDPQTLKRLLPMLGRIAYASPALVEHTVECLVGFHNYDRMDAEKKAKRYFERLDSKLKDNVEKLTMLLNTPDLVQRTSLDALLNEDAFDRYPHVIKYGGAKGGAVSFDISDSDHLAYLNSLKSAIENWVQNPFNDWPFPDPTDPEPYKNAAATFALFVATILYGCFSMMQTIVLEESKPRNTSARDNPVKRLEIKFHTYLRQHRTMLMLWGVNDANTFCDLLLNDSTRDDRFTHYFENSHREDGAKQWGTNTSLLNHARNMYKYIVQFNSDVYDAFKPLRANDLFTIEMCEKLAVAHPSSKPPETTKRMVLSKEDVRSYVDTYLQTRSYVGLETPDLSSMVRPTIVPDEPLEMYTLRVAEDEVALHMSSDAFGKAYLYLLVSNIIFDFLMDRTSFYTPLNNYAAYVGMYGASWVRLLVDRARLLFPNLHTGWFDADLDEDGNEVANVDQARVDSMIGSLNGSFENITESVYPAFAHEVLTTELANNRVEDVMRVFFRDVSIRDFQKVESTYDHYMRFVLHPNYISQPLKMLQPKISDPKNPTNYAMRTSRYEDTAFFVGKFANVLYAFAVLDVMSQHQIQASLDTCFGAHMGILLLGGTPLFEEALRSHNSEEYGEILTTWGQFLDDRMARTGPSADLERAFMELVRLPTTTKTSARKIRKLFDQHGTDPEFRATMRRLRISSAPSSAPSSATTSTAAPSASASASGAAASGGRCAARRSAASPSPPSRSKRS